MSVPFPDSIKNLIPSLEKATEVGFLLLLTSFVLLADCAALFVHGMNILQLSEMPDVLKPRLAIEAIVLVIGFGMTVVGMRVFLFFVNLVVKGSWDRFEAWSDPEGRRHQPASAYTVPLHELREKAHTSKESYYLSLFKETDEKYDEYIHEIEQIALLAFTVLVLSIIDVSVPLSPGRVGVLSQIADGFGEGGRGCLYLLGCVLLMLTFYPVFKDRHSMIYCPELARELEEKRRKEREQMECLDREAKEHKGSLSRSQSNDIGTRLSDSYGSQPMSSRRYMAAPKDLET